jgi:glycosyltransferase involved in cell wall biosynthesis
MRLVIATPLYPPEIGGPATYAALLARGLPPRGIEVEVVPFGEVRLLPKLLRHYAYYRRVKRALRGADLALALDPVSVGLPTMLAARRAKKPYVVKIVGDYAWEQGRQRAGVTEDLDTFVTHRQRATLVRLLQQVQRRVARAAAMAIVPSAYLKRIVVWWGVAGDIMVIPNAVHLEEGGSVSEAVHTLPRPLVVTAGRLVPWKGVAELIEALGPGHASLVVIGDGPLREELEHMAGVHMPGRTFFTGRLSHADTLATIAFADAFALNSTYEGLSHVLIETAALGKPIVATEAGGNGEVVKDGETGLLVPAHSGSRSWRQRRAATARSSKMARQGSWYLRATPRTCGACSRPC